MPLTVTTTSKYVKITDGQTESYIPVAQIDRLDAVTTGDARVIFNGHDPMHQQLTTFTLHLKDMATFNGSGQFTASSIAATIISLL